MQRGREDSKFEEGAWGKLRPVSSQLEVGQNMEMDGKIPPQSLLVWDRNCKKKKKPVGDFIVHKEQM